MKRTVLLDTETTGLDPSAGDRIIEIAVLELLGDLPTGETWHKLINPKCDISAEATQIHGYTLDHLIDKPVFADIVDQFLDFIGDSKIIAHNAFFDLGFINAELSMLNRELIPHEQIIDTLDIARRLFPGMPNSLDALCRRFSVDISARTTHNALLDCKLLAEVYVELTGGRQRGLVFGGTDYKNDLTTARYNKSEKHTAHHVIVTSEQLARHRKFVKTMPVKALWDYGDN